MSKPARQWSVILGTNAILARIARSSTPCARRYEPLLVRFALLTNLQIPRDYWPEARRISRLFDAANLDRTKASYDAANDKANLFKWELRRFGDRDAKLYPGGRTRRDEVNIEIFHGLRTIAQLLATSVSWMTIVHDCVANCR